MSILAETGSSRHLKADEDFCAMVAEEIGVTPIQAEEAFLGVPKKQVIKISHWVIDAEASMRAQYGWSYTVRNYKPARMIRNWARKNRKGGFAA